MPPAPPLSGVSSSSAAAWKPCSSYPGNLSSPSKAALLTTGLLLCPGLVALEWHGVLLSCSPMPGVFPISSSQRDPPLSPPPSKCLVQKWVPVFLSWVCCPPLTCQSMRRRLNSSNSFTYPLQTRAGLRFAAQQQPDEEQGSQYPFS